MDTYLSKKSSWRFRTQSKWKLKCEYLWLGNGSITTKNLNIQDGKFVFTYQSESRKIKGFKLGMPGFTMCQMPLRR